MKLMFHTILWLQYNKQHARLQKLSIIQEYFFYLKSFAKSWLLKIKWNVFFSANGISYWNIRKYRGSLAMRPFKVKTRNTWPTLYHGLLRFERRKKIQVYRINGMVGFKLFCVICQFIISNVSTSENKQWWNKLIK